jgi:predicted MPP superfamily phosphohydrolase
MPPNLSGGSTHPPNPLHDPLEESLLHRLLVASNRVQSLPLPLLVGIVGFNALLVALSTGFSLAYVGIFLGAAALNGFLLYQLRVTRRSFGPDRPSALALTIIFAAITALVGIAGMGVVPLLIVLAGITGVVFYSTWVEPMQIGVTRQRLATPKWSAEKPLRLLHIGDIHVEYLSRREQQLNRLVRELQPDLILFSGDFVNLSNTHDPRSQADIRTIISQWTAPLGVFCVPGTPLVEPLYRVESFTRDLPNLKLLPNQWATVTAPGGDLHILGMVVTHDMDKDRAMLQQMLTQAPAGDGLRLMLFHPPDVAPEVDAAGFDLYLCGHTHGGQIRLPFIGAVFSSSHLGQQFIMGRYILPQGMTLYTSRGVGMEGLGAPRARFLCPPEIILWEISGV